MARARSTHRLRPRSLAPGLTLAAAAGVLALAVAAPTPLQAQLRDAPVDPIIPGLHNTGVDDQNKKLNAGDPDPHFPVSGPMSGTPTVIGPQDIPDDWLDRQDSSLWISIADDTFAPEGTYRYRMTIDMTGFDPGSLKIEGIWAVDNAGAEIRLNGAGTGNINDIGPGDYTPFVLDHGFQPGLNTIEFVVPNLGSGATRKAGGGNEGSLSTGLRVQLTAVTVVRNSLDLAIAKSHAGDFEPGGSGTYTIAVSNVGSVQSTGEVVVTDTLPNGLTPTAASGSGWSCTIAGQLVSCTRSDPLAAGASYPPISITVTVSPDATSVTNTARVDIAGDSDTSNNVASDPTTIVRSVDLTISKRHDAPFQQGQSGTYQIVVSNVGETASSGQITVRDTLPAGLTPVGAIGSGWSCAIAAPAVTCSRNDALAPGTSFPPILLTVDVAATATTVTNTAIVEGGADGNAANNSASDLTVIGAAPRDLTIAKSHSGDFVAGDSGRTFTIRVSNVGSVASTGQVAVRDTLPAGLSPTAALGSGWTCSITGATVTCNRSDSLAAGAFSDITLTVNVAADATDVVNVATVEGGGDTVPGNNSAQDAVSIAPPAPTLAPDPTITKTHTGNATQGQTALPFTITVRNRGSVATSGVVTVSDPSPPGLTLTNASGSGWRCTLAAAQVTCDRSDPLAAGASYPAITVTANVAADAPATTVNEATVSGGSDGDAANNVARDTLTIVPISATPPDLTIAKEHTGPFQPGQRHEFRITVRNVGSGPTSGQVTMTDAVPTGLTPASASGTGWSCPISGQSVTCTRGEVLAAGAAYPVMTLAVDVLASAQPAVNVATVTGGADATPGNNSASDAYSIAGRPDLTIAKTHSGNFVQGQTGAEYTVTVRNAGAAPTSGLVTVTDTLPPGLTVRAASGPGWTCTAGSPAGSCTRSDVLAANAAWPPITLIVDVAPNATNLVNTVIVSGGGDNSPGNNTASDPTTIIRGPQVTITKRHPTPVVQGQNPLAFTITVGNNGGSPTSGVVSVVDTFPAGITPLSTATAGWECGVAGQTVTCSRSDALQPGAAYPSITVNASVSATAVSTINTVTVSGGGDTTPGDNTANDLVAISEPGVPNLTIDKQHSGTFQQGQQGAVFTIVVSNSGSVPTSGTVTVTDVLPAPLRPTAAAGDGWNCSIGGQNVSCSRNDVLDAGRSWPAIALTVNVADDAPASVVNVAEVSGGGDGTPADNRDTDEAQIAGGGRAPDLTIEKTHQDPFAVGQQDASYVIRVTNVGSAPTTGEVVVVDQVPTGFEPVSASGDGWTSAITGQIVTSRRSDSLAPGASFPVLVVRVNVRPGATGGTNIVWVSGGGDGNPANDSAEDPTSVGNPPDLAITLFRDIALFAGHEGEFLAEVQNVGAGASIGRVVMVTEVSESLTPLTGLGSGWSCGIQGRRFVCNTAATIDPLQKLPLLRFRVGVSPNPTPEVVAVAEIHSSGDLNPANNIDELRVSAVQPTAELQIVQTAVPTVVDIGGGVQFAITVTNVGTARVTDAIVEEVLPRGFEPMVAAATRRSSIARSGTLPRALVTPDRTDDGLRWSIDELAPGERLHLLFRAIAGAEARPGSHEASASVTGTGPGQAPVAAGPAVAEVRVVNPTFSMQQVLVGRVFEDVDGDGAFGGGDRGISGARVVSSTGQAAITDRNGLYNLPSISSGSVAISLDPGTIPGRLTLAGDGPGGRSWSRLLRTPIGGGALLRQDFRLVASVAMPPQSSDAASRVADAPAAPEQPAVPPSRTMPLSQSDRLWPDDRLDVTGGGKPPIPPRREYESRQGPAMMIGLGEIAIGSAAPEFELFEKDSDTDAWGFASVFYQGHVGSPKNRFTLSYDSRRHINRTTDVDRLFELDANDRRYPVMGDASTREELAQSDAKLFARLERGRSYVMFGDLIGDLPESNVSGGRMSAYSRHLTGVEARVGGATNFVSVRGAQPTTSFARDVFTGSDVGLIALSRRNIVSGTETIALEVRDRRAPERILSRRVLARNVDYRLQPVAGTISLLVDSGSLDADLNLIQVVVTYEYEGAGVENTIVAARGSAALGMLTLGGSAFSEEPENGRRFTVSGLDAALRLPRGGRLTVDLPYSNGAPATRLAVNNVVGARQQDDDGLAINAALEQPIGSRAAIRASYLNADDGFANPFAATTTPGARYGRAEVQVDPFERTRLLFGFTNERTDTERVDNERNTLSAHWKQKVARGFSFALGYDARWLEDRHVDAQIDSGLATAEARVKAKRFEAMARREEGIGSEDDPTYPTQTVLGARVAVTDDTAIVYSHRLSDAPIRPISDLSGFSSLDSKSELTIGLESRLRDAVRLTSRYQVEDGVNGPDAFAVIGAQTRLDLGAGFSTDLGLEHGRTVEGDAEDFTSGRLGLSWLRLNTLKAAARYEARSKDGYASEISAGAAGRLARGLTGLVRGSWLNGRQGRAEGFDVLAGLALRPVRSDATGLLVSYRIDDLRQDAQIFDVRQVSERQASLSTDGYWRPIKWLEIHGKGAVLRLHLPFTDGSTRTYLAQGRLQFALDRWVDVAVEQRWLHQPQTDSTRNTTAAEIGVWPLADLRLGVGYNFRDTTDPFGRDRQGRTKGVYLTISTKLARLFDLLGSSPAPAASK